jgi:hypothetical protein
MIVGVTLNGKARAYPLEILRKNKILTDTHRPARSGDKLIGHKVSSRINSPSMCRKRRTSSELSTA